jgi:anti-sigma28 factor (negative regulator of flagellin synthesis)
MHLRDTRPKVKRLREYGTEGEYVIDNESVAHLVSTAVMSCALLDAHS